jgi:hypothetical protein
MAVLEPIIEKADTDVFRLDGRYAVSDEEIQTAVTTATGQKLARVARISLSEGPFSKPHFMTLDFYRKCLHAFLQENVDFRLQTALHNMHNQYLKEVGLLFATEQTFHELLGKKIRLGLKRAMRASELHEKQWEDSWKESYRAIRAVLVCYIAYARMNDTEHMDQLEPLAKIIHRVVPYACKKFECATRIVFVA